MSTYYSFYSEAFIDGKWISIDPLIFTMYKGDYCLAETFASGSRSYFSDAWDELKQLSSPISVNELSDGLKKHLLYGTYLKPSKIPSDLIKPVKDSLKASGMSDEDIKKRFKYYEVIPVYDLMSDEDRSKTLAFATEQFSLSLRTVAFSDIVHQIDGKSYDMCGWVSKIALAEDEELYPLSLEELAPFANGDPETVKLLLSAYEYREWDDPYGWLSNFKDLKAAADNRISDFMQANYLCKRPEVRLICFCS